MNTDWLWLIRNVVGPTILLLLFSELRKHIAFLMTATRKSVTLIFSGGAKLN